MAERVSGEASKARARWLAAVQRSDYGIRKATRIDGTPCVAYYGFDLTSYREEVEEGLTMRDPGWRERKAKAEQGKTGRGLRITNSEEAR